MNIQIENYLQKISHKDTIVSIKYSPSGKFLVSADLSGEIIVWLNSEKQDTKHVKAPYTPLTGVWFSEDEKWLISGHQGGRIFIYSFPDINLIADTKFKTDYPEGYILSGTSRPTLNWIVLIVCPSDDLNFYAVLEFRDFFTIKREDMRVLKYSHISGSLIEYTTASPDGQFIFFGDHLGYIYQFYIPEMKFCVFAKHHEKVKAFDLSMRETTMDTSTGIAGLTLSHDSKLLASTSRSGGVQIWQKGIKRKEDISLQEVQPFVKREPNRDLWIRGICFIPDSNKLVLGADDGIVEMWDYISEKSNYIGRCPAGIRSIDIAPDGLKLAIGCEDGNIFLVPLHEFY